MVYFSLKNTYVQRTYCRDVKFVLNLVLNTLLINFGVSKICIKFGAVEHFILKKMVDNTKFKTNLTFQAVHIYIHLIFDIL